MPRGNSFLQIKGNSLLAIDSYTSGIDELKIDDFFEASNRRPQTEAKDRRPIPIC